MVNIFREQRHDFLNHFQVLLGYLQLNKPDRAVQYIKQVTEEMQEFGSVTKLENPFLVTALLLVSQKSKSLGIRLSIHAEKQISFCQDDNGCITDGIAGTMERILQHLCTVGEEDRWMDITLKEFDHNMIMVITGAASLLDEDLIRQLKSQIDQDLMEKVSFQVNKLPVEIRLIFHVF